ncbi:MAG TPA: DUF748 domain-containing protein [Burkholderiaceae bacterium]|nr:DUF748 domain-containing protein [Burkholderiaceae bacterium]
MVIWIRRFAWGVAALLLLWLVLWLAVPALLKWQLPLRASEALGRPVTIGDVSFRPWNLDLTVKELAVAAQPAGAEPLLRIGQVHANLSAASLFRFAPVIEALEIDALRLRVARTGDGHYDIDDLIARFASRPDAKPASEPARFALYNLQVRDAQLRFDDRPVNRVHQIEALQLTLPFISDLPAQVDIKVEPRLAFKLNGTPFDTGAQATPFAQTKSGDLKLAMADLDLGPYLGYLPATLPVRITRGSVSADLALNFTVPPGAAPLATLKGKVGAKDLVLTDAAGAPLLAWQQLQLGLRDVQPLARKLALDSLRIDGAQLHATRDAAGGINLLQLTAPPGAAKADEPAAAASAAARPPAPTAWQLSLEALDLTDARVLWTDAAVKPTATLQLDGLSVSAKQVRWPLTQAFPVAIKGALHTQAAGAPALAEFWAEGPVTDHDAKLALKVTSVSLAAFSPYLAQTLVPSVDGQLAAQARLDWSGAVDAPRLQLTLDSLALDSLRVREGGRRGVPDAVALKQLALADVTVDLLARTVALGSVRLVQPAVQLVRDKDGRLNVQAWIVAGPPAPAAVRAAPVAPAWQLSLKDFLLEDGQLRFADSIVRRGVAEPVRAELSSLRVALQNLQWHGERAVPPANVQISARVGGITRDRQRPSGVVDFKGRVGMQPLLASGQLRVERVPVQLFKPYFAELAQLTLVRAEVGYTGSVNLREWPAGLEASAAGDVLLGDVHIATLPGPGAPLNLATADELLSWQAFALKGLKVALKPKARPQVEIGEASLSDFYSRLVVTEQGRFNLQEVAGAPADAASAPPVAAATPPASAPGGDLPIDLKIGATRLINGRVDFTDHFERPNYSAALTELNGELGGFSSGSREMATLALRGRAEGTALLEISGLVNPSVKPLALDIRAKATDLELAPLSPYAGKYAGYAIERGKLTMDVAYKIDADGKLEAKNQVVLNQLSFGDKIESKDATKLPVLLAVALLKDRNGVIDINLPVSGSINDPQFSVGGIIWKVILNLLTKALTAPFSLFAGGASDDLSLVEFRPGTAQVAPAGASAIDKVAKALSERPSLKMTVTGSADPASEREAFQAAELESRLVAEQRREGLRAGAAATAPGAPASAPVALSGDERARLLKQVYKDTELPNKPRNLIGFAKDIPGPEMEALLKARAPVTTEAMRALALQRGIAVRDALIAKGLPSERLFLAAPKLRVSGEDNAAWTPRVQLSLSTN